MRVIEPGHVYELDHLDGPGVERLTFVRREPGGAHPGTQTQEAIRAAVSLLDTLVDRTNHCDACLRSEHNDRIVKALTEAQRQLRLALLHHEHRALERKVIRGTFRPEQAEVAADGHFRPPPTPSPPYDKVP